MSLKDKNNSGFELSDPKNIYTNFFKFFTPFFRNLTFKWPWTWRDEAWPTSDSESMTEKTYVYPGQIWWLFLDQMLTSVIGLTLRIIQKRRRNNRATSTPT